MDHLLRPRDARVNRRVLVEPDLLRARVTRFDQRRTHGYVHRGRSSFIGVRVGAQVDAPIESNPGRRTPRVPPNLSWMMMGLGVSGLELSSLEAAVAIWARQ
jgi:hypothetical protein